MEELYYVLAYIAYISLSTAIAYPLLKWKSHHPRNLQGHADMWFLNALMLGFLPILPFLMKTLPPKKTMTLMDKYEYFEKKRIWIWNK